MHFGNIDEVVILYNQPPALPKGHSHNVYIHDQIFDVSREG